MQPDLFIGDFDSYDGAVDPAVPVERLQPEKDDTDTGHAIRHALDQGYRTLILVCALGGRLDHTLANIQDAASAAAEGAAVTILDEREEITFLAGGTLRLPKQDVHDALTRYEFAAAAEGEDYVLSYRERGT